MSTHSRQMADYLTVCPSLVDVLFYLDYRDIENARLVNKRMNDVIGRNGSQLDRPTVYFDLKLDYGNKTAHKDFFYITYYDLLEEAQIIHEPKKDFCRFLVTDERIRLIDYPPAMEEDLLEYGISLLAADMDTDSKDKDVLEIVDGKNAVLKIRACPPPKKYLDFKISNIEEGLKMTFRLLFRRFYFKGFQIFNQFDSRNKVSPLVEMIVDEFKKSLSKCQHLDVLRYFMGLEKLYTAMGSSVFFYNLNIDIEDFLPIQRFDRKFSLVANGKYLTNMQHPLIQLLKKWRSGDISINYLSIDTFTDLFSNKQLLSSLRGFFILHVKNKDAPHGYPGMEILFKRPFDDMYLLIRFIQTRRLYLEELIEPGTYYENDTYDEVYYSASETTVKLLKVVHFP